MSSSRTDPKRIDASLAGVLKELGLDARLKQYRVLEVWPEIVGEKIARVTEAESISDGRLFVSVTRSAWRNELVFLKTDLIRRINQVMQQEIVRDIIFR